MQSRVTIREARRDEFEKLGQLMVSVYSRLEGFPGRDEQPRYYDMLAQVGRLAERPSTQLLVAVTGSELVGGVVFISDMAQYGSGGTATREMDAAGFRLLAVEPSARGLGVGKALVEACISLAKEKGLKQVIIHTTRAMTVAWEMYERMGFERSPDLDFRQEALEVFGFRLPLRTH
jgi:GNAT superfamily N-acetyltransferase